MPLPLVTSGRHLGTTEIVCLWQLGSLTAGLWVLAWMASLPWLRGLYRVRPDSEGIPSAQGINLMMVQIALALGSQLVLLGGALFFRGDWSGSLTMWARARRFPSGLGVAVGGSGRADGVVSAAGSGRCRGLGCSPAVSAAVSLLGCTVEPPGRARDRTIFCSAGPSMSCCGRRCLSCAVERPSFAGFTNAAPLILLPNVATLLWALQLAIARHDYLWAAGEVCLCAVSRGSARRGATR